jgi:hypothetical protein
LFLSKLLALALVAAAWLTAGLAAESKMPACAGARESGLPLPSTFSKNNNPAAYQKVLSDFLEADTYESLGWCSDKSLRDTGPFIEGTYYGTHPVVRVWYSPAFARWLLGGRKGDVPDGAMVIKEQFDRPPAGQYDGWTEAQLHQYFFDNYDWTVMIRDSKGSADGWYWAESWKGIQPNSYAAPFAVFNAGFGLYCVRCHASATSELTFASEANVKGLPGEPIKFRDDLSWFFTGPLQPPLPTHQPTSREVMETTHPHVTQTSMPALSVAHPAVSKDWTQFFAGTTVNPSPNPLPGENYDHVVSPPNRPQHFITSDQCFGCHSGNRYGNVMLWSDARLDAKPLVNVSPYGEWRWSPMGLAGRDPIFYAQLDSEIAYLSKHRPDQQKDIVNLCFSCHGGMGQRQLALDTNGKEAFTPPLVKITDLQDPKFQYGALAREGISCALCHHIKSTLDKTVMQFIDEDATGRFQYTPAAEIEGPFEKPVTIPMNNAFGIKPVHDEYTKNARICGTCHTIHLPVLDAPEPGAAHKTSDCHQEDFSFEQATYLEWLNSAFEDEIDPANHPNAKSCQACHMKGTLNEVEIQTQIAVVEDGRYPATDHLSPAAELNVPMRASGYTRHQFQGLNVFLLAMFDQFNETLGVRKCDYMSSGCSGKEPTSGIPFALRNFLETAAKETATVSVSKPAIHDGTLTVDVTVTNLTGHRFPSGVSFRRAFLDFVVSDASTGAVLFESGRTNSIGAIVDMKGNVLPSELVGSSTPSGRAYQPHFWTGNPITRSDQVQIYEELLKDVDGNFTTSFIRQDCHFKDNRILPNGWRKYGPDIKQFNGNALEETWPQSTADDPSYSDPLGALGRSVVRYRVAVPATVTAENVNLSAQLYYQAIPPYYLRQRFEQAPNGEGTQRLYFMTSTLDTTKTPFPGWKLLVAQGAAE